MHKDEHSISSKILTLDGRRKMLSGLYPICIKVIKGDSTIYSRTGIEMSKEDWAILKKDFRLSSEMQKIKVDLAKQLSRFVPKIKVVADTNDILTRMATKVEELYEDSEGTSELLKYTLVSLVKFCYQIHPKIYPESPDVTLYAAEMTHDFIDKWQLSIGGTDTTRSMYLRQCRTVTNAMKLTPVPFLDYKIPVGAGRKLSLEMDEIVSLWEADVPMKTRYFLNHWFLIYFAGGMNLVDLCSLRWKDLDKDTLQFARKKTIRSKPTDIILVIPEEASYIIKMLGTPGGPDDFILHWFKGLTKHQLKAQIKTVGRRINKYTRYAAKQVGINYKLTTYSARHSYATMMGEAGATMLFIQKTLGHASSRTTEKYMGSFSSKVGRDLVAKLLRKD